MIQIETSNNGSVNHIKLTGELDISTVDEFRQSIENVPETTNEIHLDFSGVEFVDSTGIGSLVQIMNQLKARDIEVKVKRIPVEIYEVFDLLGIPELLGKGHFECLK